MQRITFIILFLISLNIFGQKSEIENLVNQVASDEVSGNLEYYLLVSQSLEQPKVYDSIQNYHIKEFRTANKKVIEDLYYKQTQEKIDWKNYALKKTRLVNNENFPPTSKHVLFVEYNINEKVYDSLLVNRNSQTLVVKKKWFWSKKKIWSNKKFHKEILKA